MRLTSGPYKFSFGEELKNMRLKQSITQREKEILELMAKGKSSSAIADEFDISLKTVETHRKNMLAKFNAVTKV